jgi:REP-associated tyrosine transposase
VPRGPRIQYPDAIYHVFARGNNRDDIFETEADRRVFVAGLDETVEEAAWRLFAYCLMTNHYHLIVQTPEANLAEGMHFLQSAYANRFNHTREHSGHVFQGRYGARVIQSTSDLLHVARYVLLNPVEAGLCERADAWPWSSLRATLGLCDVPRFLHAGFVLGALGVPHADAPERFASFLGAGVPPPARPALADIVTRLDVREMHIAHYRHGYAMKDIADHLGVHPSTVTRRLQTGARRVREA